MFVIPYAVREGYREKTHATHQSYILWSEPIHLTPLFGSGVPKSIWCLAAGNRSTGDWPTFGHGHSNLESSLVDVTQPIASSVH
jgi:hypothetical protein